jgi:hypothetical protein
MGRLVKWWFPGRYFGLRHKPVSSEWKRQMDDTGNRPPGA